MTNYFYSEEEKELQQNDVILRELRDRTQKISKLISGIRSNFVFEVFEEMLKMEQEWKAFDHKFSIKF